MKIFISYRRLDSQSVVGRIRDRLTETFGEDSFFRDLDNISPGQNFKETYERMINECDVMLVIIGPQWTSLADDQGNKRIFSPDDFIHDEVAKGLQRRDLLLIPVLVMGATMPSTKELPPDLENLAFRKAILIRNDPDFDNDIQGLIRGIKGTIGAADTKYLEYYEPETLLIHEGSFWMGSEPAEGIPSYETPRHEVLLPAYRIGKYPITNAQYQEFVRSTNHSVAPGMGWDGQRVHEGMEKLPVVGVTWYDAMAYCEWLSKNTGRRYTLPNEAQWEKACRGGKNTLYPWGDELNLERSNHGKSTLAAVDAFPAQNEYGCFDLVGNVRQWTCTLWGEKRTTPEYMYPWYEDGRNNLSAGRQVRRVVRSSSFQDNLEFMRCSARNGQLPDDSGFPSAQLGFRVVMVVDESSSSQSIPPQKIESYEIKSEISREGKGLKNPYIGPRTFTREEAHLFFGREREAKELLALVEKEQLVLFYAQSGAGKSSLINARLIPGLEERGYEVLPVGRVSGDVPASLNIQNIYAYNLLRSLVQQKTEPTILSTVSLDKFLIRLTSNENGFFYDPAPRYTPILGQRVLIIDQFEELFSAHAEAWEKREDFFRQLAQALQDNPQLRVVLALRENFIASLDSYAQLVPNGFRARYSMQQLDRNATLEAIQRPAEMMARPYEPGVAERLAEDLGSSNTRDPNGADNEPSIKYVEPVELQMVCYDLWESLAPQGAQVTANDYERMGGVQGILGSYHDRVFRVVAETRGIEEGLIREWVMRMLITESGIRNMVLMNSTTTGGLPNEVIQTLENKQLVHAMRRDGGTWFELANDSLVVPILISNQEWFEANQNPSQSQYAANVLANRQTQAATPDVNQVELEADFAKRMQVAIAANLLSNNRSQAVFNDRAQGEDQLGIKDEVEALAETLLLRDVEPPVAVGIMGGWGSGKSFVMYLVNQYVQATRAKKIQKGWADKVENDPKIPPFVGHIYQVNFNAWTYAKSNLWASLMDTIFSTLNRQMQLERLLAHRDFSEENGTPTKEQFIERMLAGGDVFKKIYADNPQFSQDKELEPWHANLKYWSHHLLKGTLLWNVMRGQQVETLDKLKNTEEQLHQLKARRDQYKNDPPKHAITPDSLKKDETSRQAYFQSLKSFMLAFLTEELSAVAKEELKQQNVKEEDVQKYLKEAKGLAGGVKALRSGFRRHKIYLLWTIAFSILTVSLLYTWWSQDTATSVQLWLKPVISLFVTLLPALRIAIPWVKKSMDANLQAQKILEGAYATQQAKRAENIVNAPDKAVPQKIAALNAEISNGSLPAYDTLINLLEAQAEEQRQKIGTTAKYSNLMEFVQSRLDAATYENQLGLMHQVRQDIDELTYSLVDNASSDFFPRGKPRVILYIDDLDRCPPPRVVEVLEAVQLLLSTKLFIVILGLDTRYVTRALEKEYKEILQHEGDPSGLDYIEKIIQIPYRVRAIDKDALRKYIEKQMDIEKTPEKETVATEAPVTETVENPVAQIQTTPDQAVQTQSPETQAVEVKTPQNQQAQPIPDTSTQNQPVESELQSQSSQVQRNEVQPSQPQEPPTEVAEVASAPLPTTETPSTSQVATGQPPAVSVQVEDKISVQDGAQQKDRTEVKLPEIELPAAVIQFKQEDLDDLAVCCQRVVLTPRSIKRLVNVFKLMKIFWFRADKNAGLAERDRPRRVKQAAMSLLALSSAYPEVMREVFVHLDTLYRQGQEGTELFTALNNIKLPPGSAHELSSQLQKYKADVNSFKSITGNGQDEFGQLTLHELRVSTFNVVRSFSFVGDPVYWTDDNEDEVSHISESSSIKPVTRINRNI